MQAALKLNGFGLQAFDVSAQPFCFLSYYTTNKFFC